MSDSCVGRYTERVKEVKTYTYGLYDSHDTWLDSTNIDEDNIDFALELFKEFDKHEHYGITESSGHYVVLIGTPEEDYDPEEDLIPC